MISKIFSTYKENGIKVLAKKVVSNLARIIFSKKKLNIYFLNIDEFVTRNDAKIDIEYKFATENELQNFDEEDGEYDRDTKKYLCARMKKGDRCAIAIVNTITVGYSWVMKNSMELSMHRFLDLSNEKAFLYKNFVKREYRGKRILHGLDEFIIGKLQNENCTLIVTTIAETNISSHRARIREGYKIIGQIAFFRIFGFRFNMIDKDTLKSLRDPYVM